MASAEIQVAPDRFEVSSGEALLVAELRSAIAVCVYDADEEAGALLHLRCIVRHSKPADVTDSTLATELLLLHRCLESLRESAPAARRLQARIVAHLADSPQVNPACDIVIKLVRHYLEDAGVQVLPKTSRPAPRARCASGRPWGGCIRTPECGPRMRRSRAAAPPPEVRTALEVLLGASVARVTVIEHSWFARLHGAVATTRPRRIYLRGSAAEFFANPG